MATLYLPDFRGPISRLATGKSPHGDQVTFDLQDWVASFRKASPGFTSHRVHSFCLAAAMCYPSADKEHLRVIAQWYIALFAWDDIFDCLEDGHLMDDANGVDEMTKMMDSAFHRSEAPETRAEHPVVAAFREFSAGFHATSTPTMQQRFFDTVRQYARASAQLVHNREKRQSFRVEEFVAMRRATSASETSFACIEYILGIEIADEAYYHTAMQELRDALNDIISWTNDIYSFNKEQAAGDYQNLVAVAAIEKNLDVQSAVQFVWAMVLSAIHRYFEVKARMPKFDSNTNELVSRYINAGECVCSGLVLWHFEVDRYFGPNVGELEYSFPVKVLPSEKDALDPGFQLKYNTPLTITASGGNGDSTSKETPYTGSDGNLTVH